MLVVNRFRVAEADAASFRGDLETAHGLLAARPGYVDGAVGRNVDDPSLWVLQTRWADEPVSPARSSSGQDGCSRCFGMNAAAARSGITGLRSRLFTRFPG